MADEKTTGGTEAAASAQADSIEDMRFQINTQYVKDLSFENPNAPVIYLKMRENPSISVNVDVRAQRLQDQVFEVVLSTDVQAHAEEDTAFILEVSYGAMVSVGEKVPESDYEELLLIEVPRFLFPFVRDIITTSTRDGSFPPLLINPIDFRKLYESRKRSAESSQQTGAPGAPGADEAGKTGDQKTGDQKTGDQKTGDKKNGDKKNSDGTSSGA
ncbi:MAG: protein-export chaperone SecB [Rhodovibrionaceae bacterium]|nr:protein-export chaperone SecB [Rhodovibrionaceae bacterium]